MNQYKIIDLFAGVGGIRLRFSQAAEKYGFSTECVFSSEIDTWACKTYRKNFSNDDHDPMCDITKVDEKKHTLVVYIPKWCGRERKIEFAFVIPPQHYFSCGSVIRWRDE